MWRLRQPLGSPVLARRAGLIMIQIGQYCLLLDMWKVTKAHIFMNIIPLKLVVISLNSINRLIFVAGT
jgi:hypothetical protein